MTQIDFRHVFATCHTLRWYTCSGFGHKSQECASQRSQPRKSPSYKSARIFGDQKSNAYSHGHSQAWRNEVDQRSVGSSNNSVRCWSCNNVGHIAPHCRTMRCYSYSVLGHKAQYFWSTRKQSLRRYLDNSSRKASTNEGTNAQRTDAMKQVWMRKTKQVDQSREDGFHTTIQV